MQPQRRRSGGPDLATFVDPDTALEAAAVLRGAGLHVADESAAEVLIRAGIPVAAVREFATMCGLTLAEVGGLLGTSERTLSRKIVSDERLDTAASDRAYRLFETVAYAVHAFGDVGKALRWLRRDVFSLGWRKPIDLLRTEIGTRHVLSALDAVQFGGIV